MLERPFRTCIIGGYNKDDVAEYIRTLQTELDELRQKALAAAEPEKSEPQKAVPEKAEPEKSEPERTEPAADLSEYTRVQEENRQLREELEQMKHNHIRSEEDYEAIKKVLLDARIDAGVITAKAQERADRMIAETEDYLENRKKQVLSAFRKEMESRGIELLTSKYKIHAQIENLEKAYRELEQVKQYMENVVNNIPSGIEAIMMETDLEDIREFEMAKPDLKEEKESPKAAKPAEEEESPKAAKPAEEEESPKAAKPAEEAESPREVKPAQEPEPAKGTENEEGNI